MLNLIAGTTTLGCPFPIGITNMLAVINFIGTKGPKVPNKKDRDMINKYEYV